MSEDYHWNPQGKQLSDEVNKLLIDSGKCVSADDCAKRYLFLFRPKDTINTFAMCMKILDE